LNVREIINYFNASILVPMRIFDNILMLKIHTIYLNVKRRNRPRKETVILFCCHFQNESIMNEFKKIVDSCNENFDIILLYDISQSSLKISNQYNYHFVHSGTIRKLGYKNEGGFWYNTEYAVLDFYLKNPYYRYYWRMDYDVKFNGEWADFFNSFLENDSDLLATYVRRYEDKKQWRWWDSLSIKIDTDKKIGVFGPLLRYSNRALKLLDEKYKSGIYGFNEIIIPTLLNLEGFKISDIGEKWYDRSTFLWRGEVSREKNKLLHPIKF
jgi:hypothetical protein